MPIKKLHPQTDVCIRREMARGIDFTCTMGCAYVDMARGLLAKRIYDALNRSPEHDTVVFIDEDQRWDSHDLDILVRYVRDIHTELGVSPLLHGTYAKRGTSGDPCHQRLLATEPCQQPRDLVFGHQVFPAVVGGLGFCGIHRDGFLHFAAHCAAYRVVSAGETAIDMFPTGVIDGQWYGEDILHCLRQFQFGNGSYWLRPLCVEHMSSTYGAPLAPRYPNIEAMRALSGDTEPHRQEPHPEPDQEHSQDAQQ